MLYGVASNTTYTYTAKTGDKCLLGKGAGEFPAGKALPLPRVFHCLTWRRQTSITSSHHRL